MAQLRQQKQLSQSPQLALSKPKTVLVAGAGPAGIQAARTAAMLGHKVILAEKTAHLGGLLNVAAVASYKQDLRDYLAWTINDIQAKPNVRICLETEVKAETVKELRPDALVLAVGSTPRVPNLTVSGNAKLLWVGDAELLLRSPQHDMVMDLNGISSGKRVVVLGAGVTALEFALDQALQGQEVSVIARKPRELIALGEVEISMTALFQLLEQHSVRFVCESQVQSISDSAVHLLLSDGSSQTIACDTVVYSYGFAVNSQLLQELSGIAKDTVIVGDATGNGGSIYKAVSTAYEKCLQL
jgi:NADPH-dependent 2,4-dienoyl-CoA reductase/sulfur reductase-like enzyme